MVGPISKTLGTVVLCSAVAASALAAGSSTSATATRTQRITATQQGRVTVIRRTVLTNAIEFDAFLAANPAIANALTKDPALIDSKMYLAANKALESWLNSHPQAAKEIDKNPGRFLKEAVLVKAAVTFEHFLAAHPDIAQALASNPNILKSNAMTTQYAVLQAWLQANPDVAKFLDMDAKVFLKLTAAVNAYETQKS